MKNSTYKTILTSLAIALAFASIDKAEARTAVTVKPGTTTGTTVGTTVTKAARPPSPV